MKYLIAHDLGTSGNKATLFTTDGECIKSCVHSYETHWYNGVWAEQNPESWYDAVKLTTRSVLEGITAGDVAGISFSGQMMGCLCVDTKGVPLMDSIIWADMRSAQEEAEIRDSISPEQFYRITGHRPSSSYTLAKILWVKHNKKDVFDNTYKILNAKDYIIFRLTGVFATDYSDASGTNLLHLENKAWSETIADALDFDLAKMPELYKSTDVVGGLSSQAAEDTGLLKGTPVVCGGGDGSVSALGAMSIEDGDLFCTLGTSAWNSLTSSKPFYDEKMRTFNWLHVVPDKYLPCGTMQAAGASISWMKRELAEYEDKVSAETGDDVYFLINKKIEDVAAGSNGICFLPYLMGERSPRWNSKARGAFIGLKMENTRAEMFRSVYEGLAYNLEIILKLIAPGEGFDRIVFTGGGAKSDVLCQIFADIYNTKISVPNYIEEATSIGAALIAGVGVGVYDSFKDINSFLRIDKEYVPDPENAAIYNALKPQFNRLYEALEPVYNEIS